MGNELYRMVDACVNRALEGLRVCEDLMRFVYNLPESADVKQMRHSVLEASVTFPGVELLQSRDVARDEQKFFDLPSEEKRSSNVEIFRANIHRATEAIRSLEEVSKMGHGGQSSTFQKIRFKLYEIEKNVVIKFEKKRFSSFFRNSLYAILDSAFVNDLDFQKTALRLIQGGAGIVQLRMKNAPRREVLAVAKELARVCSEKNVIFIVNDYPDIALLSGADGVHIGQDDLPVPEVRDLCGEGMIIGISTHSQEEVRSAAEMDVDYIALGPVFDTRSKNGSCLEGIGTDEIKKALKVTDLPLVSIGGIDIEGCSQVVKAGCSCVAVISGLFKDGAIERNCGEYMRIINEGLK